MQIKIPFYTKCHPLVRNFSIASSNSLQKYCCLLMVLSVKLWIWNSCALSRSLIWTHNMHCCLASCLTNCCLTVPLHKRLVITIASWLKFLFIASRFFVQFTSKGPPILSELSDIHVCIVWILHWIQDEIRSLSIQIFQRKNIISVSK